MKIILYFEKYPVDVPIIFTYHAKDRLKTWRMSWQQAEYEIRSGIIDTLAKSLPSRYSRDNIVHIRSGAMVYTLQRKRDKSGQDIMLVLTATDQRIMRKDIKPRNLDYKHSKPRQEVDYDC